MLLLSFRLTLVLLLQAFGVPHFAQSLSKEPPNIIFLLTDDQRWDALGAMGNSIIHTPYLDQLASRGLLFTHAYVTTSICAVSRASILSGQYASRHQIRDFSSSMDAQALQQTYPQLLSKHGYKTAFIGKYGVGQPQEQPKTAFDFWAGSDKGQPDYEMTDEKGDSIHHTDKVEQDIQAFLRQYGHQQPFCLSVSFKAPHVQDGDSRQFIPQPRFKELYKDVTIPIPETADSMYWKKFPDFFQTEQNIARERWKLRFATPEMYQESVKNYYRLITGVDEVIGKMQATLEQMGLEKNTVIIFTSDNGFYLGEHGLAGKWYGHQESIRVPLMIYDPREETRYQGVQSAQIALNIDIAPTILSLAGVDIPGSMQGVVLTELSDETVTERQDFFYEHTFLGSPQIPQVEGVVSKQLKYMKFIEHGYEELYDLRQDPLEKHNRVHDATYQQQLQNMRSRYKQLKKQVK